jgi:GAF domain-containing protein/HAMP domain-containing protein
MMASFAIRQTIHPIRSLTATVTAIAAGDLTQVAPVETEDEIGLLARSINSMTSQIRDLVSGLERRVSERTRDLEKRAVQLQVTADVAREAAEIRDLEHLLDHSVHLISKRFSFYHGGIFLVDNTQEYVVLRAASSEGGQRMLARGHKLKIGQEGIVGYVAAKGEPRIALDVGADAIFFNNPDLPQTRSEMALPLMVREVPIGVLDVQSTKASAFTEEDIAILQILADQIALAIDNTRLLQESQQSLAELENLYRFNVTEAWHKRLGNKPIGYTYNRLDAEPIETSAGVTDKLVRTNTESDHVPPFIEDDPLSLHIPITLRGQVLGNIHLKREMGQTAWTPEEIETVASIVTQLGLALENARLLDEIRQRARNEQLIGHIASQVQSSLDIETVMKRTVMEIGQAFRANKVKIQLGNGASPSNGKSSPPNDVPWS